MSHTELKERLEMLEQQANSASYTNIRGQTLQWLIAQLRASLEREAEYKLAAETEAEQLDIVIKESNQIKKERDEYRRVLENVLAKYDS